MCLKKLMSVNSYMSKDIKKLLKKEYTYPQPEDEEFLTKIYKKREFNYHKIPRREKMTDYNEISNYRNTICKGDFKLREQQNILANFLSPYTPYQGVLVIHGTGTGKTCSAISIAEQFKDQIKRYGTKIYVLTFGTNGKETIKNELLFCTGETYLTNKESLNQLSKDENSLERRIGLNNALQFYKLLSYKTFHRKVLGEKIRIVDKKEGEKSKISYKKTTEGEIEREVVIDKITNMNNSVLIVDEAHNLTDNEIGEALKKIIKNSTNLRVVLLTATPMKNLADDIVDLLNYIRPKDDKLLRDKIFTSEKNFEMKFKEGGIEYLKKKSKGYVSFFRGNRPYTFADRVDKGVIPDGLLVTPVIRCFMLPFQLDKYEETEKEFQDGLDRQSSAAANFVLPALNKDGKKLVGVYSNDGLDVVLSQLNSMGDILRKKINEVLFKGKLPADIEKNFIYKSDKNNLSGHFLKLEYLSNFSVKFHHALKKINKLVDGKKGAATAFVYCNLTRAGGILIFQEILLQNGYLEYQENYKDYDIKEDTLDAVTGLTFLEMKKQKKEFYPATFLTITGGSDEMDEMPEEKQRYIREVFNNNENINGSRLKLILGSRVMNEGVTLVNTKEIHILDVHYNLGKVDQVIGRAIRECKHIDAITDDYKFPSVNVYRYVVSLKGKLSTDEILYQKAEKKYFLVKKVEHVLKEVAVDCPLLLHGNMFPEEVEKYKGCVEPTADNVKKGKKICPLICDFQECDVKCDEKKLNDKYWDETNKTYRKLKKEEIDYDTFNKDLARFEIDALKEKIKDLYRFEPVYTYDQIYKLILESYTDYQRDLFEQSFMERALKDLLPETENEFNNFRDTIYDKYNNSGYLILRGIHYIFQPFNQNENVPMHYRQTFDKNIPNQISLDNYIESTFSKEIKDNDIVTINEYVGYDFETNFEYYDKRKEYIIVGIIDKNTTKNDQEHNNEDVFKIRNQREQILDKKRGTGIPTMKGAVCQTAKDKDELIQLMKKLPDMDIEEMKKIKKLKRNNICNLLKEKLLELEKYSTGKNNMTYMIIPFDHPVYPFPLNLEHRLKDVQDKIKKMSSREIEVNIEKNKNGKFLDVQKDKYFWYKLTFKNGKHLESVEKDIEKMGGKLKDNTWTIILD